jgi:hypothetical protein
MIDVPIYQDSLFFKEKNLRLRSLDKYMMFYVLETAWSNSVKMRVCFQFRFSSFKRSATVHGRSATRYIPAVHKYLLFPGLVKVKVCSFKNKKC